MPPPTIPETDDDKNALRRLLTLAADPWGRLDDLASALGVSRSTVSMWLAEGGNRVAWHIVRGALRRTARRFPHAVPQLVEALALEFCDARGTWVPEGSGTGDWATEGSEAISALGDLHREMRDGDPERIEASARAVLREAHEAATCALGVSAVRKTLRLVGGRL